MAKARAERPSTGLAVESARLDAVRSTYEAGPESRLPPYVKRSLRGYRRLWANLGRSSAPSTACYWCGRPLTDPSNVVDTNGRRTHRVCPVG